MATTHCEGCGVELDGDTDDFCSDCIEAVLTGQVPVEKRCCPGHGTMAHVRGCVNHPEHQR